MAVLVLPKHETGFDSLLALEERPHSVSGVFLPSIPQIDYLNTTIALGSMARNVNDSVAKRVTSLVSWLS